MAEMSLRRRRRWDFWHK